MPVLGPRIVPFALILGARIVPFVPFALILGARIVPFALIPGARIVPFALIPGARIVPFALTLGVRIVRLVCPCDSSQRNRHGSCGHRGEQHFLEHSLLLVLSMSSATAQRYRSLAASCALSDDSVYCSMFASLWPLPFLRLYQRVSPCRIGSGLHSDSGLTSPLADVAAGSSATEVGFAAQQVVQARSTFRGRV